jgi:hypothetical protein
MEEGSFAEIAVIINEGILGTSIIMGGDTTANHAVVQSAGSGDRIKARILKMN